jgi:site-specific DNA-methyltransferase (adenine-specific)
LREKWQTERGQVWEVGRHRLMCGDSSEPSAIQELMGSEEADALISDPPYGISFDTDYTRFTIQSGASTKHEPIVGDDRPFDPSPWLDYPSVVLWGANYFAGAVPHGTWLVWDKRFANGKAWLSDAELAWMKGGTGVYIFAETSQGFVRPEPVQHPTQKPVSVLRWCIEKSKAGDRILDPFLGSGTTMVAAEQLGRICYGMEIEPKYVAVTLERMSGMGLEPKLAGK